MRVACGDVGRQYFFLLIMTMVSTPLARGMASSMAAAITTITPITTITTIATISVTLATALPSHSVLAFDLGAPEVAKIVVTSNRLALAAKDVLADNVLLGPEEIIQSGATSVVDLLQQQRGIEIARNGGAGNNASVFMRGGNNTQNVVLLDGVRIGSATTGGATWASLPLAQIDHIEIIYGPLSSLYGADAMGGVIQIFTKKARTALEPTGSLGVGSDGLRKVAAGIAGTVDGQFGYALNLGRDQARGFSASKPGAFSYNPDSDGFDLDSAAARFSWQIQPTLELGVNLLQSRLDAQYDGSPNFDDHTIVKLQTAAWYLQHQFSKDWSSRLQFSQAKDSGLTLSKTVSSVATTQTDVQWQNDVKFAQDVFQFMLESRKETVDASLQAVTGTRRTNSAAVSYLLRQAAHLASMSVRYDHSSVYGSNTNASLAYGYRLNPALRINASYGSSFRAPTFNELYYPGYGIASNKPERARNAELGLYFESRRAQLSAVYYVNKARDLLVSTNVCPIQQATHKFGCAYNVNRATMSGLTLGATLRQGALELRGSLDWQNPTDDTTGLRLARRARQHGNLALEYSQAHTRFGVETLFSDQRFDDAANKNRLGGYALLNVYATHNIAPNWRALARWNNALNKQYELAQNYRTPGSNLFFGLNYGFQ